MAGEPPPNDTAVDGSDVSDVSARSGEPVRGRFGGIVSEVRGRLDRDLALNLAAPLAAAIATLWLVVPTVAPGVLAWDTAEFQAVAPVLGTGHPTGYPAYVILGFLFTHLLAPLGSPAYLMNLLQAVLAAVTVACTVGIVQYLTGRRLAGLAAGIGLLVMPTWSPATVRFPVPEFAATPLFWRLATHADYHMFHVALVSVLFLLLVVWERRRRSAEPALRQRSDRWLVAAAIVYGVAFANHGLAWLLPPAIALFVFAVAPRILAERRLVALCVGALVATIAVLFAELPIRAAMHAPIVYGHPDSLQGFLYVAMAQQFGGSLVDPFGDLGSKLGTLTDLMAAYLGPLGILALAGIGTSLVNRPRFVLLALLSAVLTAGFAASYVNADIERYFLVPVYVAFVFVGLGLADVIALGVWGVDLLRRGPQAAAEAEAEAVTAPKDVPASNGAPAYDWTRVATLVVEAVAATAIVTASLTIVPIRQTPAGSDPAEVSMAEDYGRQDWMESMLAPADQGGLPPNAVIVAWWSDSTTLWYGQKVEGLRPDILIVDDSDRVDNGVVLMQVWDVIDKYLGQRPVFLDRLSGGDDGMDALRNKYQMSDYPLPDGNSIAQVISKKGQP